MTLAALRSGPLRDGRAQDENRCRNCTESNHREATNYNARPQDGADSSGRMHLQKMPPSAACQCGGSSDLCDWPGTYTVLVKCILNCRFLMPVGGYRVGIRARSFRCATVSETSSRTRVRPKALEMPRSSSPLRIADRFPRPGPYCGTDRSLSAVSLGIACFTLVTRDARPAARGRQEAYLLTATYTPSQSAGGGATEKPATRPS